MKKMKRTTLLVLALLFLFTACGSPRPREVTTAYGQMEAEKGQEGAVAMVLYNMAEDSFQPSVWIGEEKPSVWILPKYVGSKVRLYTIEAVGTDSYMPDSRYAYNYSYEVLAHTVIQLRWMYLSHNHMWYLEIETPDGEVYGSPLPYYCEAKEDVVYIGEHWDGKDNLPYDWGREEVATEKPVIYLYPEEPTEVSVVLDYEGTLTCTYPKYENRWTVTAHPDGTLVDAQGKVYNYLYWEGLDNKQSDFSQGFCVSGEETAAFLEVALEKLGLNRREANEFIIYWLPMMEKNPYNVISFQTAAYTELAKLHITPAPDTLIRVFMSWYGTEEPVSIPAQELTAPERHGFTVVEWGGELRG